MPARTVTLHLPGEVYERLQEQADQARRPLEAELLDVILSALQQQDEMPEVLATTLDQLRALDNQTLVEMARSHLSTEESAQLEALNLKQQPNGLGTQEKQWRDDLLRQYERTLLIRAEAAGLLQERGVEVAILVQR
ncbi:MAG: hypothetical protein ACR2JY_21325 [Chloroflexota bacterium]